MPRRLDVRKVVATHGGAVVHHHAVQLVRGGGAAGTGTGTGTGTIGRGRRDKLRQIHLQRELKRVVQLDAAHEGKVVHETLEVQRQDRRQRFDGQALAGVHFSVARVAVPLVVARQHFRSHEPPQRVLQRRASGNGQLQVQVRVGAHAAFPAHFALEKIHKLALEQLLDDGVVGRGVLQRLKQHPAQLLHVVLPERVGGRPPKRRREVFRGHRCPTRQLQPCEQQLQLQRDAIRFRAVLFFAAV